MYKQHFENIHNNNDYLLKKIEDKLNNDVNNDIMGKEEIMKIQDAKIPLCNLDFKGM